MSVEIRFATLTDVPEILRIDTIAEREERRYDYISNAIRGEMGRTVKVLFVEGRMTAFAVIGEFFGHPFLELIATNPSYRRMGIASALISNLEAELVDDRFFVSANESNTVMRDLLVGRGYRITGMVENLDPDDPEIFS